MTPTRDPAESQVESARVGRKFSIADAMILTGGVAGALWLYRVINDRFDLLYQVRFHEFNSNLFAIRTWALLPLPLLTLLTPCALLLFLRRERPSRNKLAQSRGFIGSLVATIFLCLGITQIVIMYFGDYEENYDLSDWAWSIFVKYVGFCVVSSWLPLILNRQWRIRGGWIEWLGQGVGLGWILVSVSVFSIETLWSFFS